MNQANQRVEDQVRHLSADVGGALHDQSDAPAREASANESWGGRHPVNLRLTIPLIFCRCYLTVVAGPERRSRERLTNERRKHPILTLGNLAAIFGLGCLAGLALLAVFQLASAYILTELGIMVAPK